MVPLCHLTVRLNSRAPVFLSASVAVMRTRQVPAVLGPVQIDPVDAGKRGAIF